MKKKAKKEVSENKLLHFKNKMLRSTLPFNCSLLCEWEKIICKFYQRRWIHIIFLFFTTKIIRCINWMNEFFHNLHFFFSLFLAYFHFPFVLRAERVGNGNVRLAEMSRKTNDWIISNIYAKMFFFSAFRSHRFVTFRFFFAKM